MSIPASNWIITKGDRVWVRGPGKRICKIGWYVKQIGLLNIHGYMLDMLIVHNKTGKSKQVAAGSWWAPGLTGPQYVTFPSSRPKLPALGLYHNLRVAAADPSTYKLFCLKCADFVVRRQSCVEESDIEASSTTINNCLQLRQGQPSVVEGKNSNCCRCPRSDYQELECAEYI